MGRASGEEGMGDGFDQIPPMPEPKSCPFCGSRPERYFTSSGGVDEWLGCMNSECIVMPYVTTGEVVGFYPEILAAWNRRVHNSTGEGET